MHFKRCLLVCRGRGEELLRPGEQVNRLEKRFASGLSSRHHGILNEVQRSHNQGTHGDIFFHFVQKFDPKFEVPTSKELLALGTIRVSGHTVGHDLGFILSHKVHAYNLVMWYAMVIQSVKH